MGKYSLDISVIQQSENRSDRQPKWYVKPEAAITVFGLLMMGGVSPENADQLRNIGIKNSTTRSHLVGSFFEIYRALKFSNSVLNLTRKS